MSLNSKPLGQYNLEEVVKMYRSLFESPNGRVILEDLEHVGNYHTTSFKSNDPYEMAFNEGRRSMVLYVKAMLDERMDNLIKEQQNAGDESTEQHN